MKIKYALGILLAASLFWGNGSLAVVTAQAPAGSDLRLLSSDSQAIVLELTVDDFQVETVEHAGQTYHRLIIPGMVQTDAPGEPQVPTRGTLLGLTSTEGVSVQVLDANYETLSGYRLYPVPRLEVTTDNLDTSRIGDVQPIFAPNQEIYTTDAFYPGQPVELGHTGYMRDQTVAQVQFYPVQYNPPSGELRLYRRILARIAWDTPLLAAATEARGASPAYENLLRNTILNYDALERPPVIDRAPSSEAAGVVATSSNPTLKISVTEDGLYQLNPSDLTGVGFDLSAVALSTIKMSNRGAENPIYVHDEDSNNAFNGNDYLLFYGTAITDVYTTKNVYWLEAGGGDGQRMDARNGTLSGSATVPTHFPVTLHAEEDTHYWLMPGGDSQEDHWFWHGLISPNTHQVPTYRDYSLPPVDNISTVTATARVRLKGYTGLGHRTRIRLNSNEIDDQSWSGQIIYDHEATSVPHLQNGTNTVRVEALDSGDALPHQVFVNWIELDYWDTYVAESDALLFGAPSGDTFQFEVTDFTTHTVGVFDVTDPISVTVVTSTTVVADGGGYKLQFEDTAQPDTRYLALTPAQRKSPASIELDQPSSWKDASNGADYILITHEDFYTSTLTLANYRSTSGLRVATVKIEDVYDEFNDGIFNPQAIRDFLSYAYYNWVDPDPTYVLLVSGATYDYRDLLDLDRVNYVPTHLTVTPLLGETASDNWFVAVSGDDIRPDMFIGRLTAQTSAEVDDMVNKIIYYEQNPPGDSWNKNVLLVADDDEPEQSFEIISESLADRLPFYYTANKIYIDDYPGDPTTDITTYLNNGSLLANYIGHGNRDRWAQENIFNLSSISTLNNTGKLPVVTVASCLNGFFIGSSVSMAEEFLKRQDKGAVAVWADSSLGYPFGHQALLGSFYESIFQDDLYALGTATTAAKIAAYDQNHFWGELVETFVLFGDPATPLGIPTNYPYVESTTPADGASDVPIDQNIQIVFSKPMSPTTVVLSGPGTAGLILTPTWSTDENTDENTVLDYAHTGFGYGQTLTFTISGQDNLGNSLEDGPVPRTWSFTTIVVEPSDVVISGPTTGITQTVYTFTADVSPSTAAQPITYTWQASNQSQVTHTGGDLSDTVDFTWTVTGTQVITVTATNDYGTATDTHVMTIQDSGNSSVFLPIILKND